MVVVALVGLIGFGATKTLPIFNGDSRRAKEGQETTTALVGSYDDRAASQTASAVAIGESAAALPDSRERSFMLNEVPIMLARGPAPDPKQLLAARDRRIAFLEGNLSAQREQTERALKDAEKLRSEIAEKTLEKKASDDAISTAAAEAIAANRTALGFGALAALAVIAFLWVKSNSLPFYALGQARAMIAKGEATVESAFDAVVDRKHWAKVARAADSHFTAKDFTK